MVQFSSKNYYIFLTFPSHQGSPHLTSTTHHPFAAIHHPPHPPPIYNINDYSTNETLKNTFETLSELSQYNTFIYSQNMKHATDYTQTQNVKACYRLLIVINDFKHKST